jgi:hypothetical protein
MLTDEQIQKLESIKYINKIDSNIKVLAEYKIQYLPAAPTVVGRIVLFLTVFCNGRKITVLSFNLENYKYEELIDIAKNIDKNGFIMYELDMYLAGNVE